jgi:hypothetical protein
MPIWLGFFGSPVLLLLIATNAAKQADRVSLAKARTQEANHRKWFSIRSPILQPAPNQTANSSSVTPYLEESGFG